MERALQQVGISTDERHEPVRSRGAVEHRSVRALSAIVLVRVEVLERDANADVERRLIDVG